MKRFSTRHPGALHPLHLGLLACLLFACPAESGAARQTAIPLESLDLSNMVQDWDKPRAGKSVNGRPLSIGGVRFDAGLGTHSFSVLAVELDGQADRFEAQVGVDDEVGSLGSVEFQVWLDKKKVYASGVLKGGQPPLPVRVDLRGAKKALFVVSEWTDGNPFDHADWANATIWMRKGAGFQPRSVPILDEPAPPLARGTDPRPAIQGPRITGSKPGNPFLFRVPATGEPPLYYEAENLPEGLTLDPTTGILTGSLVRSGTFETNLKVSNPLGEARRGLTIVGGEHRLALTPPLGWNSWNIWAASVDAEKIRQAAHCMVETGLADHGFQYICIDDGWVSHRDDRGRLVPQAKFGDMKALAEEVHALGLKLGIYSSPGPVTCQRLPASYGYEATDMQTFCEWGVDFLKYDWCSYGEIYSGDDLDELKKPYRIAREALDRCQRDIVLSVSQYGMGKVWQWAPEVNANMWRTTGDIGDSWSSIAEIGFSQAGLEDYARPGYWNDPDMLVVGMVGWGKDPRPTQLRPNEQILHITLWSLLAAPLMLGCDLGQMDDFTLALLTNDEVLAVNQDPLGKQARRAAVQGEREVWARPLRDGTLAVGLFNRGLFEARVEARWKDLGISGRQPVRDLWQRKDLGTYRGVFSASLPPHGARLIKIGRERS